jgi:hypothetical protein
VPTRSKLYHCSGLGTADVPRMDSVGGMAAFPRQLGTWQTPTPPSRCSATRLPTGNRGTPTPAFLRSSHIRSDSALGSEGSPYPPAYRSFQPSDPAGSSLLGSASVPD